MILKITNTRSPATDLGYLLHKNPDHLRSVEMAFGTAHVVYPEATEERCTAALLLDVDAVGLVRGRGDYSLSQYVNDRPYVATSFLSVAIGRLFGTALGGRCKERPGLVDTPLPLTANLPVVSCRGGETLLRELFEPLGYEVAARRLPLDAQFPEWGESRYFEVSLTAKTTVRDLLAHLIVLIPVLDEQKHYYVGKDEIDKLLRRGEGWLARHPAKEEIVRRYLRRDHHLTREALARLTVEDDPDPDATLEEHEAEEATLEKRTGLHDVRTERVAELVAELQAARVLDLGCGEGKLIDRLVKVKSVVTVAGVDVCMRSLQRAQRRIERYAARQREQVTLFQGALTYRDDRFQEYDVAVLVEVIEHLDPSRLRALERVIFEFARPASVILTTPNSEYNALFPTLGEGKMRHKDHRFEWTRSEFAAWCEGVVERFGYKYRVEPLGPKDEQLGAPSQLAVFTR